MQDTRSSVYIRYRYTHVSYIFRVCIVTTFSSQEADALIVLMVKKLNTTLTSFRWSAKRARVGSKMPLWCVYVKDCVWVWEDVLVSCAHDRVYVCVWKFSNNNECKRVIDDDTSSHKLHAVGATIYIFMSFCCCYWLISCSKSLPLISSRILAICR